MVRKIVNIVVLVPIAIVLIVLSVANRQPVRMALNPFRPEDSVLSLTAPFFVFLFLALLLGMIIGAVATWISQHKYRKRARVEATEMVARRVGDGHVAGGVAYVAAVIAEPGVIRHTALDALIVGELDGVISPRLTALRDAASSAGFCFTASDDIRRDLWSKFARLSVFSGMTSITRSPARTSQASTSVSPTTCSVTPMIAKSPLAQVACWRCLIAARSGAAGTAFFFETVAAETVMSRSPWAG